MSNLFSLSINGRITLDMHSLNNEGGEGNQIFSREVTIIDENGELASVNAISGDMLKHIQSEHLYMIALNDNLPLCEGCKKFDPNRISIDSEWAKNIEKTSSDSQFVDAMVQKCIIDDTQGILLTSIEAKGGKNNANLARKSAVEYGWIVGIPEYVDGKNYFHVKLTPGTSKKGSGESDNTGQNIFYRPANSGIYSVVVNVDLYKIGFNNLTKTYSIQDDQINKRYKALLKSILNTFIQPKGAMRNTQNPHIVKFEGVISTSSQSVPAPTVSSINSKYKEDIVKITDNLNKIYPNAINNYNFDSLGEFTEQMEPIINNSKPYKLQIKEPAKV